MPLNFKKRLFAPIINVADYLHIADAYFFLREKFATPHAAIIMYHRIDEPNNYPWSLSPTRIKDFEDEIKYLTQKYNVISLDKLIQYIHEKKLPLKTAVITLDDGYKDHYLNAYPLLKKYNVPATIFLTTGRIYSGDLFWSDKVAYGIWKSPYETFKLEELGMYSLHTTLQRKNTISIIKEKIRLMPNDKKKLMIEKLMRLLGVDIPLELSEKFSLTWDEAREMSRNRITFGAHTVTHPKLSALTLEDAKKEIVESKKKIEEELNVAVTAFAYPLGRPNDFNYDIMKIVKNSGFTCAVTSSPTNMVEIGMNIYKLPRISPGTDAKMFKLLISELYFDLKIGLSHIKRGKYET